MDRDAFREKGAGPFSLHVQSETFDSLVSVIGLRLAIAVGPPDALAFPSLYLGWEREWADLEPRVRASIGEGTSIPFEMHAPEQSRNRGLLRFGWETILFESVSASLYYDARVDSDFIEHGLLLGAHRAF